MNKLPVPKITSFVPAPVYRDTTVTFILNGNYFQPGGRTTVNLTSGSGYNITTTLSAVYPTAITGTATIPPNATSGAWKVNVTTVDGGEGTKAESDPDHLIIISRIFFFMSPSRGGISPFRVKNAAEIRKLRKTETGLGGFEPPTSGLEARRYVQAKPQAHCASNIRAR